MRQKARAFLRKPFVWRANQRDLTYSSKFAHELAICAIFREEAPFLDDWINFHQAQGVTQLYLYNNFSTDSFGAILAPHIASGLVSLIDWPVEVGQIPAYRHCISHRWRETRWIAFIDIDEFLFSPEGIRLPDMLEEFGNSPGVHVWQAFFGSNGHDGRPEMPVPLAYTRRAPLTTTTVKTIANPRQIYKAGVHEMKFWHGNSIDMVGRPVRAGLVPVLDGMRINHYWSRSIADLKQKVARGDASTSTKRDLAWHFDFEKTLNDVEDETIIPIAREAFGL
jgi:Glycosyltransferase family 92